MVVARRAHRRLGLHGGVDQVDDRLDDVVALGDAKVAAVRVGDGVVRDLEREKK